MTGALFHDWQTGRISTSVASTDTPYGGAGIPGPRWRFLLCPTHQPRMKLSSIHVLKCCQWVRAWGYGGLWVVNAFALRSTDPAALRAAAKTGQDPVGPENDDYIHNIAQGCHETESIIVVGSGRHASLLNRHQQMRELLADFSLHALGINKDGSPEHPLYLRKVSKPMPWPQ